MNASENERNLSHHAELLSVWLRDTETEISVALFLGPCGSGRVYVFRPHSPDAAQVRPLLDTSVMSQVAWSACQSVCLSVLVTILFVAKPLLCAPVSL